MNITEIADEAVETYLKLRGGDALLPDQARAAMLDHILEMTHGFVVIEEPECCDALPRIEWLHHSTCPEVQAHHAQHDTSHPECPTCAVQRRPVEAQPGTLQH